MHCKTTDCHMGTPVLQTVKQFQAYISTCFDDNVTHVAGSPVLERVYEITPASSGLITPDSSCKSVASSPHEREHVLLVSEDHDIALNIMHAKQLTLPRDRVTVVCTKTTGDLALKGDPFLQLHSEFLFSAAELNNLGFFSASQAPPHFVSSSGCAVVLMSVYSNVPAVGVKPSPVTPFDSFM